MGVDPHGNLTVVTPGSPRGIAGASLGLARLRLGVRPGSAAVLYGGGVAQKRQSTGAVQKLRSLAAQEQFACSPDFREEPFICGYV